MSQARNLLDDESPFDAGLPVARPEAPSLRSPDEALALASTQLALSLHLIQQRFETGDDPGAVVRRLGREMHGLRAGVDPDIWKQLVPIAQGHPVAAFVHQDPFTRWSFDKPRGYSGDAQLLDFIYGHESVAHLVSAATPLGRAVFGYSSRAPAPAAVRERRDLLARHVDEIAGRSGCEIDVLAIAAGHLREAELSSAFAEKRVRRWVALDQDPVCVATVARDQAGSAVEPFVGSVRGLLGNAYDLGRFDFAYAAGLYDYLPRAAAVKLTRRCMTMLKPGGTFLFANFFSDIPDDGYMESFMNWPLILRSEAEMWDIVNASVDRNAVEANVVFGENRNIVYAIIRRHD